MDDEEIQKRISTEWLKADVSRARYQSEIMGKDVATFYYYLLPFPPEDIILCLVNYQKDIAVSVGDNMFNILLYKVDNEISIVITDIKKNAYHSYAVPGSINSKSGILYWLKRQYIYAALDKLTDWEQIKKDREEKIHEEIINKNLKSMDKFWELFHEENVILDNYIASSSSSNILSEEVTKVNKIKFRFTLTSINYKKAISSLSLLVKDESLFINQITRNINKILVFHSYIGVMEDMKWSIKIRNNIISFSILLNIYLIPNDKYYETIGYYLTEVEQICRNKKFEQLPRIAKDIHYDGDKPSCQTLLDYIYTLKWTDF